MLKQELIGLWPQRDLQVPQATGMVNVTTHRDCLNLVTLVLVIFSVQAPPLHVFDSLLPQAICKMAMFTASRAQVATYLLAVCPFSIAFLVFLNSSVSFVITDLLGKGEGVGDAVGNLGFADELVALVACPLWGLASDRIGVRTVCCLGYVIIGIALFLFVQAKDVYPQLLLGRLFFSIGGAAASTMVTAILPTMSFIDADDNAVPVHVAHRQNGHNPAPSVASELTITPQNYRSNTSGQKQATEDTRHPDSTSKIAGFVGMATGCGALIALSLFLPLPARFQKNGAEPGQAIQYSYYIVGGIAMVLAVVCFIGLHGLQSEKHKGFRFLLHGDDTNNRDRSVTHALSTTAGLLYQAFLVGFTRKDIFIGYVGGFVARASSVGISLFVPLLINAAFLNSDLCKPEDALDKPAGLPDIKRRCPRAYVVAAELTGISQLIALLCAPLFGYWASRISNKSLPLVFSAVAGIIGYPLFATKFDAHDENRSARAIAFVAVALIGISQIGAIVSSLGILSSGILRQSNLHNNKDTSSNNNAQAEEEAEIAPLLGSAAQKTTVQPKLTDLKGSVAGVYSFYGGAGILILTKAGGALFDSTSTAAPFYMMAIFNAILLVSTVALSFTKS